MNYSYEPMRMYDMCSCFFFLYKLKVLLNMDGLFFSRAAL